MRLGVPLLLALLVPGCAYLQGPGEEVLVLINGLEEPTTIILVIEREQRRLFSTDIDMDAREGREFPLALDPGRHIARVTTSSGVGESVAFEVPARGDSRIELRVIPTGARLTVSPR